MKKCCVILLLLIFVFCLSACCKSSEPSQEIELKWIKCGSLHYGGDWATLYYDSDTKVIYMSNKFGKTAILNADGTPMLYEEKE